MATTRKTISVTEQQDSWIKAQIESGDYTNDSEYIRDLIRRDQAKHTDLEAIKEVQAEQWLQDNRTSIQAHNKRIEKSGTLITPDWAQEI